MHFLYILIDIPMELTRKGSSIAMKIHIFFDVIIYEDINVSFLLPLILRVVVRWMFYQLYC